MDSPNTPNTSATTPATGVTPGQIIPTCRHIQPNGHRCPYPALAQADFCYYHGKIRRPSRIAYSHPPVIDLMRYETAQLSLQNGQQPGQNPCGDPADDSHSHQLPPYLPFENAESIQIAITALLSAMSHGQVDRKQAHLLLHALRLASSNIRTIARMHPSDVIKPRRIHRKKPPNPNRMSTLPATL